MPSEGISNVADTAFWIAEVRAREGTRADALFQDPFAARLSGTHGKAIADSIPWNFYVTWSVALRTVIIDDLLTEAVDQGVDRVLNLGAGLDARPYRLNLPASLQWVEADQPAVISYKSDILKNDTPHCALTREAVDLADAQARRAFLARALEGSRHAIVLTEGVIPYLSPDQVSELAADLNVHPAIRSWILDYNSPLMMAMRRRQPGVDKLMRNAPFRFDPPEWEAFYASCGWKVADMRYFVDESRARKRPLPVPWWRQIMIRLLGWTMSPSRRESMRRIAGFARMERIRPHPSAPGPGSPA
jgi:methyltransferase (TIGR00027 family)